MTSVSRRVFLWTSPTPLVMHVVARWYVGRFDGWGAWAAAPLLLPGILLSAAMLLAGLVLWRSRRRAGRDPLLLAAVALAGSVFVFYFFRALSRGIVT